MLSYRFFADPNRNSLRLFPSELNRLITAESKLYEGSLEQYVAMIKPASSYSIPEFTCYRIGGKADTYLFHVTKDSPELENEPYLPYVVELIQKIKADQRFEGARLLIPVRQCCSFFGLPGALDAVKRAHIVLLEVDFGGQQVYVHDSQAYSKCYIYPDYCNQIAVELGFAYEYHAYGAQGDDVLCGYYVHQYVKALLSEKPCASIKIPLRYSGDHEIFSIDMTEHYEKKEVYLVTYGSQSQ